MKLMVKHGQPCAAMCLQESGSRCGFMALRWLRCLIWSCFCNSSSSLTWWNWVYTLSHVFGVLGLGFLKLGKFFTRMLRLRMTLGSLVFRPIVRDFTLAAGIHSLFSSSLKPFFIILSTILIQWLWVPLATKWRALWPRPSTALTLHPRFIRYSAISNRPSSSANRRGVFPDPSIQSMFAPVK